MALSAGEPELAPRGVGKSVITIALVFLAYFVAGRLGQATTNIRSSNLGPVWPAYGVAVAALLLCGYRVWIGVVSAAILVAFLSPVPHIAAVGQGISATLAALTAAVLLRKFAKFDPSISRLRDALALIAFGAMGSAVVSASIGISVLYAAQVQAYSGIGSAWLIYWLGDSTGVLLVTPLILTFPRLLRIRPRVRLAECAVLLLLLGATCFFIFGDTSPIEVKLDVLAFIVLPFVMWAAIRLGVGGAALATFAVATIATLETAFGNGPFAQNSAFIDAVLLDVFFAVLAVTGMVLATVIAERERAEHEREKLVREQAAMEARLELASIVELSDERFRLAAQAGKMYAYEWDSATNKIVRSDEYVNVFGLSSAQAKELSRDELALMVHPDDRAAFIEFVGQLTPENATGKIRYRVLRVDGSVIWVEKHARAFFDEQSKLRRMVGMVADISENKQAEEALRASEDKLRTLLDSTAEAIYGIDLAGRCTFCNPACLRALGYGSWEELIGKNMHELIHHSRADGTACSIDACQINRAARVGVEVHVDDEVFWRANGTSFPVEYWSHPQRRGQEVVGAVIAFIDITERKTAAAALASVSRRLITAQERERTRIARELHDDIGQRLTLLAVKLEQLHEDPLNLDEVRTRVEELERDTHEIANDIQSLSHELHSAKLEHLGMVTAMRSFCHDFGEKLKVEINFKNRDLPNTLPPDISLCFFRVLQEALHNSAKYSGASHFEVELWGTSDEVRLRVSDSGAGFDVKAAKESRGLGLVSMEERLKTVNGELLIESQPKRGTTIHARVPLRSENRPFGAAG